MNNQTGEMPSNGEKPTDQQKQEQLNPYGQLYEKLDSDGRKAIDDHIAGLSNALKNERDSQKLLKKELSDALKNAQAGSEAAKAVQEISARLEQAERKNAVFQALYGIGVTNAKLAYLAITADGLVDDKGVIDVKQFSDKYPELIRRGVSGVYAGDGARQNNTPKGNMDNWIRQRAGK
jgi:hypothetical protein